MKCSELSWCSCGLSGRGSTVSCPPAGWPHDTEEVLWFTLIDSLLENYRCDKHTSSTWHPERGRADRRNLHVTTDPELLWIQGVIRRQPFCKCQYRWKMGTVSDSSASWGINTSLETCVHRFDNYVIPPGDLYCNWTWDTVLCWPPTRAGTTAKQRCPSDKGVDSTKFAYKRCSIDGRWEGRRSGVFTSPQGWTNYTPCYTPEMLQLIRKLYAGSEDAANVKLNIAERTRTLEIVGFSVSLAALLLSLAIFCHFRCWWGYNLTRYFWILEGPRIGVIVLNLLFLLNIIRVLVVKLRQSHTSEIEQVRKAVRAALVLLPLLGITNLLNMTEAPLERTVWEFALWSYSTHFLTSFQGLFIAFLYCFLNGEVRLAVRKSMSVYLSLRQDRFTQRTNSALSGVYVTTDNQQPQPAASPEVRSYRGWLRHCCQGKESTPPEAIPQEYVNPNLLRNVKCHVHLSLITEQNNVRRVNRDSP
ncbi:hypothetical protein Cfor_07744 [Coptotermes formosanus]|uniref:G-protein coupled receptors family 2 profile 1 domain-containing protein n=1 Tax=Coptotermes formosanus TaxID=36987 RepID=A0A6L2Q0D2_COPFO|nr:hypothetical protein Cfor_07744 [Coptotermes formosanus]